MNILFRAEGNKIVGLGHLYRISRLACQLTSSGHACTILTAHLPAELKTSLDIWSYCTFTDHVLFLEDSVPQNCSNLEQPIHLNIKSLTLLTVFPFSRNIFPAFPSMSY